VHTEWQLPISVVHSIMMEKSAQAGESGGCTSTPFHRITIMYKGVAVYAPAERADTPPLFHLYPTCTLWWEYHRGQVFYSDDPDVILLCLTCSTLYATEGLRDVFLRLQKKSGACGKLFAVLLLFELFSMEAPAANIKQLCLSCKFSHS
jgi:hypothetical protein